ncbi:transcription factor UPBEAT1 [Ananas comosus]|uniref:Transcription factor UPBEAT1 n=1 Tax=Ananas comosus TaxID=4615 RepID=A0A6P5G346_ANACO|nr:transcription factor UPBEAT1 [Ananas comosus]
MATRKPRRSRRSRTDTHSIRATRHHAATRARRRFKKQMAKTKRAGTGATTLITTMLKMTRGRALLEGSREPVDARLVERKVGELRRLVPQRCGDDESVGLEGLLRVAADYVMWLEMQVKVMKIMLSVFSPKR